MPSALSHPYNKTNGVLYTLSCLKCASRGLCNEECSTEQVALPAFHGHAGNISVNYSVYGYVESNGRH